MTFRTPMDCRSFRKKHLAFVDDVLPGVELGQMQEHLAECETCAAWDHRVRRSLMVVRNHLSSIEPSQGFGDRLAVRLASERVPQPSVSLAMGSPFRWGGAATLGLALAIVAGSGALLVARGNSESVVARLPIATVKGSAASRGLGLQGATPAYAATMSSGMAILPALMLAEEVPIRRVSLEDTLTPVRPAGMVVPTSEPR